MKRYKQNLNVTGDVVTSYQTHVATISRPYLIKHAWNVGGMTTSPTTSKHINYVARELNLTVISESEFNNLAND